jgi:uncharacterized protein YukE
VSDSQSSANGQVHVDTAQLKGAGFGLAALADRLKNATRQFSEDCSAQGEAWGGDKGGKKFSSQYLQPHEDAETAGETAGSVLSDSAGQLSDLATALSTVENQSAVTGQQLAQPNDGA